MAERSLPDGFHRHELGLLVPVSCDRKPRVPEHVGVYLTHRELTGTVMHEHDLVASLRKLSAADCLAVIAYLNARLFVATDPVASDALQHELVADVAGDGPLAEALRRRLHDPRWTSIVCEQQLVHLARLVLMHADDRPRDHFDHGRLHDEWLRCLIGVTDLLDAGLAVETRSERLAWELRQCGINHREDQLPVNALHHELYRVLWRQGTDPRHEQAEEAFRQHTGMTIAEYFTIGSVVMARLTNCARQPGLPAIRPGEYFASAQMDVATWRAFFDLNGREVGSLRTALVEEAREYGPTTYGSLTLDRTPLAEIEPDMFVPLSMASLQRRITQGVLHILADVAEEAGLDRRRHSSAFGPVFQASVEQTLRRGLSSTPDAPAIVADVEYGPRRRRRCSSDVILAYDRNPVFVEVVSGPLRAATLTRGDLDCFELDVDRLVVRKARQLGHSIRDFFAGDLRLPGVDPCAVDHAWPVIVASHDFPHADTVVEEVDARVAGIADLRDERIGQLAILSAEDLFFCEGFMQQGRSFLSLLRSWKSGSGARLPFKNHLVRLGGGRAPGSRHFERRFAEANAEYMRRLFGSNVTADEVLARVQGRAAA